MSWRGIATGVFALIVLEVLVANPRASGSVGGVLAGVGTAVRWFLDPNTPAIPDRSKPTPAQSTSATTAGPNVPLNQGVLATVPSSSPTANLNHTFD